MTDMKKPNVVTELHIKARRKVRAGASPQGAPTAQGAAAPQASLPGMPALPRHVPAAKPSKPVLPSLTLQHLLAHGLPDPLAVPLFKAVTTMRGGESVAEANFVAWLLAYCSHYATLRMVDAAGNVHFTIPTATGQASTSIFVAHTDTVHRSGGPNNVGIDGSEIHAVDEPLGADDGAGIAILCYMMYNKVPGRYIFSRQEESGGVGAKFIKENLSGVLKNYNRAIAFDRRGTSEVIIMQGGSQCASDEFGEALADALNEHGMLYTTSEKGVYTDTKEFRGVVPECVNIATGYYQEHGSSEHLDLDHFTLLALAAAKIDWENLPTVRDPKAKDPYDFDDDFGMHRWMGGYGSAGSKAQTAAKLQATTVVPKTQTAYDALYDNRMSPLEDAVFDWYWGRKIPLVDLLVEKLAKQNGITEIEARGFIKIDKLREAQVDAMDFKNEDLVLSEMIKIVTA